MTVQTVSKVRGQLDKKEVRLLIVQELDEFRLLLEDWVEVLSHNYNIAICSTASGQDGSELLMNWQPSVVLLDAHIADTNSFSFINQCRKSCIPIFITSSEQSAEIESSVMQSGASGYFPAMDDPALVEELIANIVDASSYSSGLH